MEDEYTTVDDDAGSDVALATDTPAADVTASPDGAAPGCVGGGGLGVIGEPCCTPDELACAGHAAKLKLICLRGVWTPNGTCDGEQLCSTTKDPGTCKVREPQCIGQKAGESFCVAGDPNLYTCDADLLFYSAIPCVSYEHCNAHAGSQCAACFPGVHRCSGNILEVCAPDRQSFVTKQQCPSSVNCSPSGNCEGKFCLAGQYHCNGKKLQKCAANEASWVDVASADGGVLAPCAVCEEGIDHCLACPRNVVLGCSGTSAQRRCSAEGEILPSVPCPATQSICLPSTFQCVQCTSDASCTSLDSACSKGVCSANSCTSVPINEGKVLQQDERACTGKICSNGKEAPGLVPAGTICDQGQGTDWYCTAAGVCAPAS